MKKPLHEVIVQKMILFLSIFQELLRENLIDINLVLCYFYLKVNKTTLIKN